ncbi:hypothetical protein [Shinella sp. M31]|jgi:hypothetical protein|uniref:hypothetical protein n=1 Tax=Shinella sp. M31 TaxID=3368615 RepID=UPI003BA24182
MTALSITAANVVAGTNSTRDIGTAGTTITAGQAVYLDTATNKWLLADTNSATAAARVASAIALNSASLNQPISLHKSGDITIGATVTAGVAYYLGGTAGTIVPVGDLTTGDYPQIIGIAKSATVLAVDFQSAGVAL